MTGGYLSLAPWPERGSARRAPGDPGMACVRLPGRGGSGPRCLRNDPSPRFRGRRDRG